jgi:hypothetical protein
MQGLELAGDPGAVSVGSLLHDSCRPARVRPAPREKRSRVLNRERSPEQRLHQLRAAEDGAPCSEVSHGMTLN